MKLTLSLAALDHPCVEDRADIYAALVEALVDINRQYLRREKRIGFSHLLYESSIVYVRYPEEWQDIPSMLSTRRGDCKDLVAWRIAELRERGCDARVHVIFTEHPEKDEFHLQVAIHEPDPRSVLNVITIEDPSDIVKKLPPQWSRKLQENLEKNK